MEYTTFLLKLFRGHNRILKTTLDDAKWHLNHYDTRILNDYDAPMGSIMPLLMEIGTIQPVFYVTWKI